MPIYIDKRGGSIKPGSPGHLPTYICRNPLILVHGPEIVDLEYGDVMFLGNGPEGDISIGIELKSIKDLVSSIVSKRLQLHQLPGMVDSYDVCYLTYYGNYKQSTLNELMIQRYVKGNKPIWEPFKIGSRRVPYSWLAGFLAAVDDLGVRRERLNSRSEMVSWLASLYRRYTKPWDKHKSLQGIAPKCKMAVPYTMDEGLRRKAIVATALHDGIGHNLGLRAANRFSTVKDMINASVEDWESIHGFGKVRANAVVRAINEP